MKVLITGCGRHSKSLVESLKHNPDGERVEIIGINNNPDNILRVSVDKSIIAPSITAPDYIQWLYNLCETEKVDVVLPYITAELPIVANAQDYLEESGAKISVSSPESLRVANDKIALAEYFGDVMPRQMVVTSSEEIRHFARKIGYYKDTKLCCKLADKCGGTGFAILDEHKYLDINTFGKIGVPRYMSIEQLCEIADKLNVKIILQEYIPGTDYSVCVLADHGKMVYECGFAGYTMEFGAVTSGEILKNKKAYEIAERAVKFLELDGNCCFDFIIKENGDAVLLECNPRLNATLPFVEAAGAPLAYYRCKQLLGGKLPKTLDINYGLKMVKYYESYYY